MESDKKPTLKVIGAGHGRTGTSSLKKALEMLGLGPCYHMSEVLEKDHANKWYDLATGKESDFETVLAGYQSAVDNPAAGFYKELMEQYPDAKVILTLREPESWYQSCEESIFPINSRPPNPHRTLGMAVFMAVMPSCRRFNRMMDPAYWDRLFDGRCDKEHLIRRFSEQNEEIKRTVPAEKLLVFEVKQGWEPLCKFLSVPIPDVPFPHENDREAIKKVHRLFHIGGNLIMATAVGIVAAAVALGVRYCKAA